MNTPSWYYHSLESRMKRRQAAGTAASAAARRRRKAYAVHEAKTSASTEDQRKRGPVCPRCGANWLRENTCDQCDNQ